MGSLAKQNAAYLLIRGIKTMHLRVKQQNSTALRMAHVLEAHPKVFLNKYFHHDPTLFISFVCEKLMQYHRVR